MSINSRQKAEELLSKLMPTDQGPLLHEYGGYVQVVGPFEYALIDVIRGLLDELPEEQWSLEADYTINEYVED